jgi:hypothetical protein
MRPMPALITQALDDNLKILLIAEPSKLSHLLVSEIQRRAEIGVELISPLKFSSGKLTHKSWYKLVLLFEHPLIEDSSLIERLCFLPNKTIVVMPLTTAIKGSNNEIIGWDKQLGKELDLYNSLVENIDVSRFIFYTDLVKSNTDPVKYFFSQFQQSLLIDPSIELNLQTIEGLVSTLTSSLLKPQKMARIIKGKPRISSGYLQKVKELYLSHHRVNLPIKRSQLQLIEHPIFKNFSGRIDSEISSEKTDYISKEVAILMSSVVEKKNERGITDDLLQPPTKKKMVESWNEVEVAPQKLRLDLEHDVETILEIDLKSEEDEGNDRQPNIINTLFKDYRSQQKREHLRKLTKGTKIGFHKIRNQKFLFGGGILISVFALGILISVGVFFTNLSQAQGSLLSYLESRTMPVTAQQKKMVELESTVDKLNDKLALINKWFSTPFFSQAFQLIEISRYVVDLSSQVSDLEQVTSSFFQKVIGQEGEGSLELVNEQSIEVFKTLSLLSAELKNYPLDKLSPEQAQLISSYQDLIEDQEREINQFQQLSPVLPKLLAQDETKTYALVLQNNQELRPTGGFIQAVALITFKQGSLLSFQVEDVYTIDQRLKATISPPDEIKKFLGEERWFLRDSNWSPSFPQAASQIKWFLDKSMGVKVDGVIGINLEVLEEIIGVLNQVEVEEYNEVITKKNLSERMEFHSEVQLVEAAQNRDYAELILFKTLNKIQSLPKEQVVPLLSSITEMAESKELLVTIFDNDLQATFESLGWNGSIVDPACPTVFNDDGCLVDVLMQVEANVGVNKANYYLERQIDHSVSIASQEIAHKRVITFKNKAQTNAWPKGPYKSYVRFYLPEQSEFKNIKINGQEVGLEQIVVRKELERQVVGVPIEVAVKSELKLQLEYSLPHEYQTPFTYAFFDQKQPGARDVSPRIFLKHEPDLSPTLIAPQAEVQGEVIVFNPSKDRGHVFIGASFE